MVQGHGRCPEGIALSSYHASGLKRKTPDLWGQSPRKPEERVSNRMARRVGFNSISPTSAKSCGRGKTVAFYIGFSRRNHCLVCVADTVQKAFQTPPSRSQILSLDFCMQNSSPYPLSTSRSTLSFLTFALLSPAFCILSSAILDIVTLGRD